MPSVQVADETAFAVTRELLAVVVADPRRWVAWWPGLEVQVVADRGPEGLVWSVTGPLVGRTEVTLVASDQGVLLRYRLDADPTAPGSRTVPRALPDSPRGRRELDGLRVRQAMAWKRTVWALKDEVEARAASGRGA